jgi:diguanylate cyclase (GGDEF)-like protein
MLNSDKPQAHNILIVDDQPTNLQLLTQILTAKGYRVRVAPDGKLALDSVRINQPDLILLDINMPGIDGYGVCEQLKSEPHSRDIPIIFISSLDEPWDKQRAFDLGGNDYITKPFEMMEVIARIKHQLERLHSQKQLKLQNSHLQLLLQINQAINRATQLEDALDVILAQACQTLGWSMGEAWLADPQTNILNSCGSYFPENVDDQTHGRACLLNGQQDFLSKVWQCEQIQWMNLGNDHSLGLKSLIGVPIIFDQQFLGALLFGGHYPLQFDQRALSLLGAIGDQVGSLIHRWKIEDDLKRLNHALSEANLELNRANLELRRRLRVDGLTGVANRQHFDEYLEQQWRLMLREQKPLALIFADVDYFKLYNDHYGHQAGDICLQQVAQAMQSTLKRPADLLARYGGEEFAVILPNTPIEGAVKIAQEIQMVIRQSHLPHASSRVSDYVTISIGVTAVVPRLPLTAMELLKSADQALYEAKQQGRDRLFAHPLDP